MDYEKENERNFMYLEENKIVFVILLPNNVKYTGKDVDLRQLSHGKTALVKYDENGRKASKLHDVFKYGT